MIVPHVRKLLAKADASLLGNPFTPPSSFPLKAGAGGVAVLLLAFVLTGGCADRPEHGTADAPERLLRSVVLSKSADGPASKSSVVWYPGLNLVCLVRTDGTGSGMACWDPDNMYSPGGVVNVLRRHQAKAKAAKERGGRDEND